MFPLPWHVWEIDGRVGIAAANGDIVTEIMTRRKPAYAESLSDRRLVAETIVASVNGAASC